MTMNGPESDTKRQRRNLSFNRILRIVIILVAAISAGSAFTIHIAPIITTGGTVDIKEHDENTSATAPSAHHSRTRRNNETLPYKPKNFCTGDKNCETCKNCKYCKNCNEYGGTCGVCTSK